MSPEGILRELKKTNLSDISIIIVPGAVSGDVSTLSKELGVPCFKGPKNLSDVPLLLKSLPSITLSTAEPADSMLSKKKREEAERILKEVEKPGRKYSIKFSGLFGGGEHPIRVIAEIPDAPLLTLDELKAKALYYKISGADVVDVGLVAGSDNSDRIGEMVEAAKSVAGLSVSVDTLNEREILAGVEGGCDLVLSIDEGNMEVAQSIDVPVVVVARDKEGKIPETVNGRCQLLEKIIGKISQPAIADPLLTPIGAGFDWSIAAYIKFRRTHPDTPMMLGAGNVTELLDADSAGANALLAGLASELGIEFLFTTEASPKTRGCVRELATATKMMYLAKTKNQPPKDLGVDLLVLKDKIFHKLSLPKEMQGIEEIECSETEDAELDDINYRIQLLGGKIQVFEYMGEKPSARYTGDSAEKIYKTILAKKKTSPQHAAYLGRELHKAETAKKLNKNYLQDEDLF